MKEQIQEQRLAFLHEAIDKFKQYYKDYKQHGKTSAHWEKDGWRWEWYVDIDEDDDGWAIMNLNATLGYTEIKYNIKILIYGEFININVDAPIKQKVLADAAYNNFSQWVFKDIAFENKHVETYVNGGEITPHLNIKKDFCDIYKPTGKLLCHCDNKLTLLDIQCQIKFQEAEGYYVKKGNKKFPIRPDGIIEVDKHTDLFPKEYGYRKFLMDPPQKHSNSCV